MAKPTMVLCRKCETVTVRGAACNCAPAPKGAPRFSVWFPKERRYVSGEGGGLAWTHSRAEAEEMAQGGGVVVDTDDFAKNWPAYARGERTPQAVR